jgi:OmpR family response regulator RpaB
VEITAKAGAVEAAAHNADMPTARRLLLIDDDEHLGPPLAAFFRRFDIDLQQAMRPSQGLALLQAGGFDAAILDIMLPEMDGFELCRHIRAQGSLPVIMLTARGDVMDRVVGLEMGADDYLPKPFEPRELLARIQTVLRRTTAQPEAASAATKGTLHFEGLLIDQDRRSVLRQGAAVELTGTEFELLVLLATTPGKVFSRDDILARLRGHSAEDIHSRAVDILVSRLRRKLEPLDCIHTLRNAGYLFAGVRGVRA